MQLQYLISQKVVSNETVATADARKLHKVIGSKQQFSDWITNRITKYGFVENVDYLKTTRKVGNATAYDYHITLDMAKELCMVENNEKGREARRHFIDCEKHLQIGQEQYDRLKETVLVQNAQIVQLTNELKAKPKRLPAKPRQAYSINDGAWRELSALIAVAAEAMDEADKMSAVLSQRANYLMSVLDGFTARMCNDELFSQSRRSSPYLNAHLPYRSPKRHDYFHKKQDVAK